VERSIATFIAVEQSTG